MTSILKLANVESSYGPIRAIRGVSLQVVKGQIATVLGSNGAGKTTILKTISGILDPTKDETILCLRGRLGCILFDETGGVQSTCLLEPGSLCWAVADAPTRLAMRGDDLLWACLALENTP